MWNTVCRVFTSTSQSFFIRTESRSKGWGKWYNGTLFIAPITTAPLKVCLQVVMIRSRPSKRQQTKSEDNLSHPEPLDFILCAQYSLKWIVQLYCSTHFASVIITIIGWPRRYQNKRASNIYAVIFLHAQCNQAAWLDLPNSLRQDELGRKSSLATSGQNIVMYSLFQSSHRMDPICRKMWCELLRSSNCRSIVRIKLKGYVLHCCCSSH